MKTRFPSTRTCTIEAMLLFASNTTRESKQRRVRDAVAFALNNITQLNRVPKMRWSDRKRAISGLAALDKIGITEKPELLPANTPRFNSNVNDLGKVVGALGLFANKINGKIVITLTPLTIQPTEIKSLADMPPHALGQSSPELPLV